MALGALLGGVGAAAGGIGGGLFGSSSADKARRANQKNVERMLALIGDERRRSERLFGDAGDLLLGGRSQLLAGFGEARDEIGRVGSSARRRTLDRERQALASTSQGLAQRGLGNTTVAANAARGVRSDTDLSLADIDERIAGLRSGLAVQQGGAAYAAEADRARLLQALAAQHAGLTGQATGVLSGVQYTAQPTNTAGLGMLGYLLGSGVGGMFGGGAAGGAAGPGGVGGAGSITGRLGHLFG